MDNRPESRLYVTERERRLWPLISRLTTEEFDSPRNVVCAQVKVERTGKQIALSRPQKMFAQVR
eukprot:483613-Prorocentrum_minimum.AAC.1